MALDPMPEELLREAVEARKTHISGHEAARSLGLAESTFRHRLKMAARRGLYQPVDVPPGFEIAKLSETKDASGKLRSRSIQMKPEREGGFNLPPGHAVKGLSTLLDGEGRVAQQWIKTKAEVDPLEAAKAIREAFANWTSPYVPSPPAQSGREDRLAFFPVSDMHIGMLAHGPETGENWDLRIAKRTFLDVYSELVQQTPHTDEAFVLFGGDQQHADNFDGTTERSGHALDVDGRYPKVHLTLCELAVEIVMMVRARYRRVKVRVLQGNHDRASAVALSHFLYAWFRNDELVEIDISPSMFWFYTFGDVLLCGVHGHTIKARDVAGKVAATQPRRWGEATFRHCHYFHEHHDELVVKDEGGMKVEKHAIIAPADAYHAAGPWASSRNAKSIIYDATRGEVSRSVVNIVPASAPR